MENSLVVEEGMLVKFHSVPFPTCLLYLQLLLQGSFHHIVEIHKDPTNIMNYLGPSEAPDHLPPATLLCLPEQGNHCGKNFGKKTACLRACWWSKEPAVSKYTARKISS